MSFRMMRSSNDEKLFHDINKNKDAENIFTLGRGSYGAFDVTYFEEKAVNVLGGRFSSLAGGIIFLMGGNHPIKSVSSFPFDIPRVVESFFGKVHPGIRAVPKVRHNPHQIIFGSDVWIGRCVTIMGGVKIGNGAVLGANAVVAKDIPPYAIAVGNPARVVKYRFDEDTIKKLLAVKWWNWSLEKIADNLPLMNDVEKFLDVNYSPALEEFPADDSTRQLNRFTDGKIYHFVADFRAQHPLWPKVVRAFDESNFTDKALVIWLGKDATDGDLKSLTEAIDSLGDTKENIVTFKHEENFSPAALRKGTHFITTREMTTLEALDYLWDTDVKVVSALDDKIFSP